MFAILSMLCFPNSPTSTHLDASPAGTVLSGGPFRTQTPLSPAWRNGRERPEKVASALKSLLDLEGESAQAVKDKPTADDRGLLAIFLRYAPCRSAPSAPSNLDCPPFQTETSSPCR